MQWDKEKWSINLNSFGQYGWSDEERLYNHAAWQYGSYHWTILDRPYKDQNYRFECDDFLGGVCHGDYWKVFIR